MLTRVLVTGGAGFIGSHLAERLLSEGREVVVLDNFDDFYARSLKERNLQGLRDDSRVRVVEGDIRDPDALARLPEVSSVVHLAALAGVRPSIEQPTEYMSVNVSGTSALFEFCRSRSIDDFVLASSSSVYGELPDEPFHEEMQVARPISPYAASKAAAEVVAHAFHHLHGIRVASLRFFTAFGPRQRPDLAIHKFARLLAAGSEIPLYGDGSTARDYTFIGDIVEGVTLALGAVEDGSIGCEILNLGRGDTVRLDRMVTVLAEEMGVEPRIRYESTKPGDVSRTLADIGRAREVLGWSPGTPFREGIREFVEWFSEVRVG